MLKHKICSFALACLVILPGLSSGPSTAAAAAAPKNTVYVDKENHSYVPLRFLSGFAGIQTDWNAASKRIVLARSGSSISFTLGQRAAVLNEQPVTLTEPAFRDSATGTLYVPLSVVSQSLGIQLAWNRETSSLTLSGGEESAALPVLTGTLMKADAPAVTSARRTIQAAGRSYSVQTVTVSLLHPKVKLGVVLAGNQVGKVEGLSSIAKRSSAVAAINGTFFDAYTSSAYKVPYGYIFDGGKMLMKSSGNRRAIFTYNHQGLAELIPGLEIKSRIADGSIEGALQAGPRLLVDGKIALNVVAEGFKDDKILTGSGSRSALGLTRDHKLILLTTSGATIRQLAEIMKQAGAYQAMNLDGGASSGLYYGGKYLTTPGRQISNALIVKVQ
ncbi:phosphodiester glycosidase family protein [Paenibacillus donghaensis]|uniref:Copper amine oxidase n=1 Tax=Paenibacillus donghaensis TaxID=414771 RepID=A0A2Z2KF89_9BACL|nr:phosphodiester glycosidase family protein [Paenibacillus donghaensis]ASA19412.1 copper amine oxidase [Paenibacillus donghaensis]